MKIIPTKIKQILMMLAAMTALLGATAKVQAANTYTFTGSSSGVWNNSANWTVSPGPGTFPGAASTDIAVIPTGKTVTGLGGTTQTITTLTVQGTGILNIDSSSTLNVSGVFTLGNSASVAFLTNNGTLNLTGTGTSFICDASVLTNTAGSIFTCAGGNTGNANDASPTFGNNGTATFTGATVPFSTGNKAFKVINGPNGVLNLNNSVASFGNSATLNVSTVGNTVNLGAAGAQNPYSGGASVSAYYNLTLSGSGSKTPGGASVAGTLSLQGTATAGSSFTYGSGATLAYAGSSAQTATANEFPSSSGSANLTINNSSGVTLPSSFARTISGTVTLTSGTFTLTSVLTLGNGANIIRTAGSFSAAPTFGTSVNVTYNNNSSTTTGSELPTSTTALNNLTINNLAGVVLNANAKVNGTFAATYNGSTVPLAAGAHTLTFASSPVNITVSGSALTPAAYTIVSSSGATVSGTLGTVTVTGSGAPYSPTPTAVTTSGQLVLTITAPPPSITGAATTSAFTTTYGTASANQSFAVSGANLTANLVATAGTGFQVATSSGGTYGSSVSFTETSGSASGTVYVELAPTASASGSAYNSENAVVLSSTGATSANITTPSSGNVVNQATATVVVTPYNVVYDGNPHSATVTSITGVNGETGATVGTVDVSNTTHTSAGTYASDFWTFTGTANYNNIGAQTITDVINGSCTPAGIVGGINASAMTLCVGSPVILTLTNATGSGPLAYQWQTNDVDITAATNASFTNLAVAVTDAADYTCIVTNACGSITSSVVTLTVNTLPSAPTAGSVTTTYNGALHVGTATAPGGSGVEWFTAANGGGSVTTAPSGTAAGTYTAYAVSTNNITGCESATSTQVTVQINPATATFTVTPYTVTYNGGPNTATVGTITGVNGETGSTVGTVTLTGTTHTAAGTYASDGWSFAGANYTSQSGTITDTINPATATVTVTPYTVTYDGNPHTATATLTGVNGETGSTVGTVNLSGTTHTAVGTYTSDSWSFTGANYNSQSGSVTDTINAAPISYSLTNSGAWTAPANWSPNGIPGPIDTATIDSGKTLTGLGTNQSCSSLTVQDNGILNIESTNTLTVSNTLTMGSSSGVAYLTNNGTLNVNGSGSSFVFVDGSVLTNTAGSTFTCAGGNSANANASPVFGNNGTATFTGATVPFDTGFHNFTVVQGASGVLNLDNSVAAFGNSGTLTATAVGNTVNYGFAGAQSVATQAGTATYYNLTLSGSGSKAGSATVNGTLSLQGAATAGNTVTYGSGATLVYAGSAQQTSSANELPSGGVPNLTINNASGVLLGGNSSVSSQLTLTAGILNLNGHTLSAGTVTVTAGSILLTPTVTLNNKVYDGTTTATTIATRSLAGTLTGDSGNVTLGTSGTVAAFSSANVGSYTPGVTGLALGGTSAARYSLSTTSVSPGANITKATASVTVTPYTVTYDGSAHTASAGTVTGVNGETGSTVGTVTLTGTTHTAAGTYASDSWTLTGGANYNNISAQTITDTINKATASVTVTPYTVTYDGSAHTASAGTVTGVNGETGSTVGTVTLTGTTHTAAGTYASDSWTLTGGANYNNIGAQTITDTIGQATATVVVTPYTVAYDGNPHSATVTSITGVNGETGSTVGTVDVSGTTHTAAGTYPSDTWAFTGTANYNNISAQTISDTIYRATAVVSGTSATNCSGTAITLTATLTGTGPWNVTWSDGHVDTGSNSPDVYTPSPTSTTVYTVTAMTDTGNGYSAQPGDLTGSVTDTVNNVTANATAYTLIQGASLRIAVADLLTNASDPSNDVALAGVGADGYNLTTVSNFTLWSNGTFILYTNSLTAGQSDSFQYAVSNLCGSLATNTVTVNMVAGTGQQSGSLTVDTNGNVVLTFYGIPGQPYYIQRTTSLVPTVVWTDITGSPFTADPATGIITTTDTPPGGSSAYYYQLSTSP